jgi:low temperature requirement protein LtrA
VTDQAAGSGEGKRVSWVELYLDLIVVLAVGQLAHVIADDPSSHSVWISLGLFVVIWWTWIGFAVLYNRHGDDDWQSHLVFLVGSVPLGVAAVAIHPASAGDAGMFAASMAAVRLVLAFAHAAGWRDTLRQRAARAYLASAALFAVSIVLPGPGRYVLWAIAVASESGAVLTEDRDARRRAHATHDVTALAPRTPGEALDPHHFAERFGAFIIILLGEVVVDAGQASVDGHVATAAGWAALIAAMILAASLWWLYFDAAAEINLRVLELSGGSPAIARTLFALGHMLPTFALLLAASGIGLLLEHEPPTAAYWLACVGVGVYFVGTRVVFAAATRLGRLGRSLVVVATFWMGTLHQALSPHAYVWVLTGWVVVWTASASWRTHHMDLRRFVQLGARQEP